MMMPQFDAVTAQLVTGIFAFFTGGAFATLLGFIERRRQFRATTQEGLISELNKLIETERARFALCLEEERKRCVAEASVMQQRVSFLEAQVSALMHLTPSAGTGGK